MSVRSRHSPRPSSSRIIVSNFRSYPYYDDEERKHRNELFATVSQSSRKINTNPFFTYDDDENSDVTLTASNKRWYYHSTIENDDETMMYPYNTQRWYRKRNNKIYMIMGAILFFVVILPVSILIPRTNKNQSSKEIVGSSSNANNNIDSIVNEVNGTNEKLLLNDYYDEIFNDHNWMVIAENISTPQGKALYWVTNQKIYTALKSPINIQRYALAVLYYSTYHQYHNLMDVSDLSNWTSAVGWITDMNECQWEGISCNDAQQVTAIVLPGHNLTGTLPIELAMLHTLYELNFNRNFIFMEGTDYDVFLHLTSLKRLRMENNFLVSTTGIPTQFSGLKSLEVLQLNYNILQGELVGSVFTSLQNLRNLEMESNYLSGSIPSELGQLPYLSYIFARRNNFEFSLESLIPANAYPSIFSIWLDNNKISGSIPTTIGLLSELNSLSISNGKLTGPIPTEFGLLTNLRRVWLYGNDLTGPLPTQLASLSQIEILELHRNQVIGTMPSAICDAVYNSTFQYRALTADCDSLSCDCCTECF